MFNFKVFRGGLLFVFLAGCASRGNGPSISVDSLATRVTASSDTVASRPPADGYMRLLDTLTRGEEAFLKKLARQNENLIWTKQVERILAKDSSVAWSKLVFPANFLMDSGYRYLELSGKGLLTNVDLSYYFDRGEGATGYGSVVGYDTTNFTHTINECGTGGCITEVFKADKNIAEICKKVIPSDNLQK